ncbi:hypothetical protein Efla_006501 [Eimeria flavescens]
MASAWPSEGGTLHFLSSPAPLTDDHLPVESGVIGSTGRSLRPRQRWPGGPPVTVFAILLASLAAVYLLLKCRVQLADSSRLRASRLRVLAAKADRQRKAVCVLPTIEEEEEESPAAASAGAAAAEEDDPVGDPAHPAGDLLQGFPPAEPRLLPELLMLAVEESLGLLGRAAEEVMYVLPFIDPQNALLMTRTVCKLACLEASSFAAIPDSLQPLREQVVVAFAGLIDQVLAEGPTAALARDSGSEVYLRTLSSMLLKLSGTPSNTESMEGQAFEWLMAVNQQLSHWCTLNIFQSLNVLKSKRQTASQREFIRVTHLQIIVMQRLLATRTRQILSQSILRHWVAYQQRGTWKWFLYELDVLQEAEATDFGSLDDQLIDISVAVVSGGGSLAILPQAQNRLRQHVVRHFIEPYWQQVQSRRAAPQAAQPKLQLQQLHHHYFHPQQQQQQQQRQKPLSPPSPPQGPLAPLVVVSPKHQYFYTVLPPSGQELAFDDYKLTVFPDTRQQQQQQEGHLLKEGEEEDEEEEEHGDDSLLSDLANQDLEFPLINPAALRSEEGPHEKEGAKLAKLKAATGAAAATTAATGAAAATTAATGAAAATTAATGAAAGAVAATIAATRAAAGAAAASAAATGAAARAAAATTAARGAAPGTAAATTAATPTTAAITAARGAAAGAAAATTAATPKNPSNSSSNNSSRFQDGRQRFAAEAHLRVTEM